MISVAENLMRHAQVESVGAPLPNSHAQSILLAKDLVLFNNDCEQSSNVPTENQAAIYVYSMGQKQNDLIFIKNHALYSHI